MTQTKKFKNPEAVRLKCERSALSLLNLRGSPIVRDGCHANISLDAYTQAAGLLTRVCKLTGETPRQVCTRLGIHGAHRATLMPYGTDRWRLNAWQKRDSYRTRDTRRGGGQSVDDYWRRRCEITGLTEAELRAKDRAFDAMIKRIRMASGPPNPARKIQQYADPPRRKRR